MRILVTGSRDWDDWPTLTWALLKETRGYDEEVTLVHGGCSTGADHMADVDASLRGWKIEVYQAQWGLHGKKAGPIRNIEMVDAGADICVAFIKGNSRGATHCADAAEKAGIPVRRYRA
jgi:hypothetical protein